MIEAQKIVCLERLFVAGLRWVMHRRFYGVFLRGKENLTLLDSSTPLIVCTNHSNWWDGFAAALLSPLFPNRCLYLAQYEKLLARYRALRWLGVFGLDREGLSFPGIRYALRLLANPRNIIWIFPQGVLDPQWLPIHVKPGALWLARRSGASVLPIAFRYEWLVESRPSIFISLGRPLQSGAADEELRVAMQELYDGIGASLAPLDMSAYHPLFKPRMSMNKRWERLTWLGKKEPFNPRNE